MRSLFERSVCLCCFFSVIALVGCASNPYGYSRTYKPLSAEEDYYERAIDAYRELVRDDPRTRTR